MTSMDSQIFPHADHIIEGAVRSLEKTNPVAAEILASSDLLRENNLHTAPKGGGDVYVFDVVVVLPSKVQIIDEGTKADIEKAIKEAVGVWLIPWYHVREVRLVERSET